MGCKGMAEGWRRGRGFSVGDILVGRGCIGSWYICTKGA